MTWQTVPPIPPPPAGLGPPPPRVEAIVTAMTDYAFSNIYSGPHVAGSHLGGWPIETLFNTVFGGHLSPQDKLLALVEIQKRFGNLRDPGHSHGTYSASNKPRPYTLEESLAMRMRWRRADNLVAEGFSHIAIHSAPASTVVHVWVITKDGQATTIEDDVALFPSDALVTKLNLLKG